MIIFYTKISQINVDIWDLKTPDLSMTQFECWESLIISIIFIIWLISPIVRAVMKLTKKLERSTKTLFYKLDLINEVIKEGRGGKTENSKNLHWASQYWQGVKGQGRHYSKSNCFLFCYSTPLSSLFCVECWMLLHSNSSRETYIKSLYCTATVQHQHQDKWLNQKEEQKLVLAY